jgi:hypothetical protein
MAHPHDRSLKNTDRRSLPPLVYKCSAPSNPNPSTSLDQYLLRRHFTY